MSVLVAAGPLVVGPAVTAWQDLSDSSPCAAIENLKELVSHRRQTHYCYLSTKK